MANQYCGSFEHRVKERFNCSAKALLEQFSQEGVTYDEAQSLIGITHGTIRKWAKKYNLELRSRTDKQENNKSLELFYANEINQENFLSRPWQVKEGDDLLTAIPFGLSQGH